MKIDIVLMLFVLHLPEAMQYSNKNSINIVGTANQQCRVENDRLYINGKFVRYLTRSDREQLYAHEQQVALWNQNLGTKIEHELNEQENERRAEMNAAFGPQGSFHQAFTGEFWESLHLSTPAPTTMPIIPSHRTAPVRQMPYPDPPAFCNLARSQ